MSRSPASCAARQAAGDFATVIRKGDPERGSLLLLVTSRGRHVACLERVLDLDGGYRWQAVAARRIGGFRGNRPISSPSAHGSTTDLWAIELDIAEPERFIAETTAAG